MAALSVLLAQPESPGTVVETAPLAVLGVWTTGDARFAGRSLRVTPTEVVLTLGDEAPPVRGTIREVRSWQERGSTVVSIDYMTEGGVQSLEMIPAGPGRMRLRNPPEVIWTR